LRWVSYAVAVRSTRKLLAVGALGAVLALGVSACNSSVSSPPGSGSGRPHGRADVAYAGSLQLLDETVIGPAFAKATGDGYQGRGAGSLGLSQEIRSGEISPNVFESIGAAPITALEPRFTTWYVQFAASPLVVAYTASSPDAAELDAIASGKEPLAELFRLMARPGFLLGRTNPDTDPQGQAFYEMVELAQAYYQLPAGTAHRILGALANPAEVFAETALDSRLEAGQLDAASAFLSQAVQLHLRYIKLPAAIDFGDPALAGTYARAGLTLTGGRRVHGVALTVDATVIGHTDRAAADAFVAYQLSAAGRAAYRSAGYELLTPSLVGTGAPAEVRHALGR